MSSEEKDLLILFADLRDNIPEAFDRIKNCSFMYSKIKGVFLAHLLVSTARFRTNLKPYLMLSKMICDEFPEFRLLLFSELIRQFPSNYIVPNSFNAYFMRKLYKEGIFTIKEIVLYLSKRISLSKSPKLHLLEFLFFFYPEIKQFDSQKCKNFKEKLMNEVGDQYYEQIKGEMLKYIDNLDDETKNEEFLFFIEHSYTKESNLEVIENDNVDKIVELTTNPSYDPFQWKIITSFPISNFLSANNHFYCSAYFGSVNCFKFFLLNQHNDERFKEYTSNVLEAAVCGGNFEIIRLSERYDTKYERCVEKAVKYLRFDIFDWLINFNVKMLTDKEKENCMISACVSNNFIALESFLAQGFDYNIYERASENEKGQSIIDIACLFNHKIIIETLIRETDAILTHENCTLLDKEFTQKMLKLIKSRRV